MSDERVPNETGESPQRCPMKECQLSMEEQETALSSATSDERVNKRKRLLSSATSDGKVPDEQGRGYSLSSAMSNERAPDETGETAPKLNDV